MKSLKYLIAMAALLLAIAPSLSFGQVVYNTGTQGCCGLLDPHYTLVAAPQGVTLGNVYSTTLCPCWVQPLAGSWWINPIGTWDAEPVGSYTFQQTFTLTNSAGAILTGTLAADDNACVTLNGGQSQCTPGGYGGYEQYTPFEFTTGFQVGTNTLDFVVNNLIGAVALEVVISGPTTEKKLHNFGINGTDGVYPQAGLIFDAAGNLYGTTADGGDYGVGTVFELTPNGSGGWTEKKLHNFGINSADGNSPSASLIFDAAGNLYGTTQYGGDFPCDLLGCGTVFELTPDGSGGWTEKKLHNFGINEKDGIYPRAGLIFDGAGNLYGTTYQGGSGPCSSGCGTVFELTPTDDGGWTEKKLHSFGLNSKDGIYPFAGLVFDAAGNLYGTTYQGGDFTCGDSGCGTVFELTRTGGRWLEKKLHNFGNGTDGANPYAGLTFDAAGNLYGTTAQGGDYNNGTVFELTPNGSGGWTERKLHNFGINNKDATLPQAGLIFDDAGNLYGTTAEGGDDSGGTVFEITR